MLRSILQRRLLVHIRTIVSIIERRIRIIVRAVLVAREVASPRVGREPDGYDMAQLGEGGLAGVGRCYAENEVVLMTMSLLLIDTTQRRSGQLTFTVNPLALKLAIVTLESICTSPLHAIQSRLDALTTASDSSCRNTASPICVVFQISVLFPFNNGDFFVIERTSTEVWRRSWRRVGFDEAAAAAEDAD
jgi:hypothetical protein